MGYVVLRPVHIYFGHQYLLGLKHKLFLENLIQPSLLYETKNCQWLYTDRQKFFLLVASSDFLFSSTHMCTYPGTQLSMTLFVQSSSLHFFGTAISSWITGMHLHLALKWQLGCPIEQLYCDCYISSPGQCMIFHMKKRTCWLKEIWQATQGPQIPAPVLLDVLQLSVQYGILLYKICRGYIYLFSVRG